MAGEIEAYQDARMSREQHEIFLQSQLKQIHQVSRSVANGGWKWAVLRDEPTSETILSSSERWNFDPASLPTGESIKTSILEWRRLQQAERAAFDKVSPERRSTLPKPI